MKKIISIMLIFSIFSNSQIIGEEFIYIKMDKINNNYYSSKKFTPGYYNKNIYIGCLDETILKELQEDGFIEIFNKKENSYYIKIFDVDIFNKSLESCKI